MRSYRHSDDADAPEPSQLTVVHANWWREGVLPLYGLPVGKECLRIIGEGHREYVDDHDGRGPQMVGWHGLGLGHGNPISEVDPWLHVMTATIPGPTVEELLLGEKLRQQPYARLSHPSGVRSTIMIDGRFSEFEGIEEGDCWAIQGLHAGYVVSVAGIRWPRDGLELVRIDDPEPYLSGWTEFLQNLREGA